eukprot:gene25557-33361_t
MPMEMVVNGGDNDDRKTLNNDNSTSLTLSEFLLRRWKSSKLRKFYELDEVDIKDVDNAINTIAVLNGLILTIPFGLMSLLGQQFWDCVFFPYHTYTLDTLLPYLLKPADEQFFKREWWPRAKWMSVIILLCTVVSIVSLLCLFNLLVQIYVQSTDHLCTQFDKGPPNRYAVSAYTGIAVYLLSFLYAVLIMF